MINIKLQQVFFLFIILLQLSCNLLYGMEPEGEDFFSKSITFRVYHLHVSIEEALRDKDKMGEVQYYYYPCKKKPACQWISKRKSITAPHAWSLISQGIGRELAGEDESDRNKGEHWVYDIPAEASTCREHFAIVFGMGEFFKSQKYSRSKLSGGDDCETWVIDEAYGDQNFGYEIVRNLVEKPQESSKTGVLEGKPFNKFCSKIKGSDFCSMTMCVSRIEEFPGLCAKLWTYRKSNRYEIYQTIHTLAEEAKHDIMDMTDEILKVRPDISEKAEEDEGEEFDVEVSGKAKKAVRVFGRFLTFEGFEEYIERTKREIRDLIDRAVDLPSYNEKDLEDTALENEEEEESPEVNTSESKKRRIDWEGRFNAKVAKDKGYFLLDKKCVENVEICDVWVSTARQLVHVKIGTNSSVLNHLFGQGFASATLLAREDFSEKMILELIRKELVKKVEQKVKEKFATKKDELWKKFNIWREKNKTALEEKYKHNNNHKLYELIKKIEERKADSQERIKALRALHAKLNGSNKEELGKIIGSYEKGETFDEDEISNFLEAQLKKVSTPLNTEGFPEDKNSFKQFCTELRTLAKENEELQGILDSLELYRVDLIEDQLKGCWEKNEEDLKLTKASPITVYFFQASLKQQTTVLARCNFIFENLLKKYDNKRLKKTSFSVKDLREVLLSEEMVVLYKELYQGFIGAKDEQTSYQVVYAIITDKDPEDKNILPLGARINLLKTAKNLRELTGKKTFVPVVQIIPNVTQEKKPKDKKEKGKVDLMKVTLVSSETSQKKEASSAALFSGITQPCFSFSFEHPVKARPKLSPQAYLHVSVDYRTNGKPVGLHDDYILTPTNGDGNCFFHAIFTEDGETLDKITARAAEIRDTLRTLMQRDPSYIQAVKRELMSKYQHHFHDGQNREIPDALRIKLKANEDYIQYRQSVLDIFAPEGHPVRLVQQNAPPPFNDDTLLEEISDEECYTYLDDYRSEYVGQEKAYIQIPTGIGASCSLGDIICRSNNIYVHCFLYERDGRGISTGKINFTGSIGDPTSSNIRYVLQDRSHYWALYREDFLEEEKARLRQIRDNENVSLDVTPSIRLKLKRSQIPNNTDEENSDNAFFPEVRSGDEKRFRLPSSDEDIGSVCMTTD